MKMDLMHSGICCCELKKEVQKKVVLQGVNFKAHRGKVTALLGPNGAGKTTCFSILCGLCKASSGRVYLDGKDITNYPMYKRARLGIGYLPQEASIFRGLTVEENILAVLEMNKTARKEVKERLETLLQDLGLVDVRSTLAVSLSGGERRRLEIARALANNPKFILLDEPLAGVDPIAIEEMRSMIVSLKNRSIGVVITDHNVRDTLAIADYVYILFEGKILIEGTSQDIINSPLARETYLGNTFSS